MRTLRELNWNGAMTTEQKITNRIIGATFGELVSRSGFEAWWQNVNEEERLDILKALRQKVTPIVEEAIEEGASHG